jgi:hypothetical protein
MKMTILYTLTAIVLQVFFQSVQAEDYRHYFPLKLDNNWQYRFEKTETIYALPDSIFVTVQLNGITYYTWGDNQEFPIVIRQDENGRIYRRVNNEDKLWFDFTGNHGDVYTWSNDGDDIKFTVTVRKNVSVMTYAGQFENCIEFHFDNPESRDDEFSYTFAPDIGIVKKQFSRKNLLLVSAQIDRRVVNRVKSTKRTVVSGYSLAQNYPNPFNPTTFIQFSLPEHSYVSLDIFDIRGVKVRSLVGATQSPGEYISIWDGTDDTGLAVSSGIYNYRLATDAFTDIRRMVLLR